VATRRTVKQAAQTSSSRDLLAEKAHAAQSVAVTRTRRTFLQRVTERAMAAWKPLSFSQRPDDEQPLTLAEFEQLCNWETMRRAGIVGAEETPLSVSGLRTSRLFPRHLLHRGEHGRTVLLTAAQARGMVAAVLLRRGTAAIVRDSRTEGGLEDSGELLEAHLGVDQRRRG